MPSQYCNLSYSKIVSQAEKIHDHCYHSKAIHGHFHLPFGFFWAFVIHCLLIFKIFSAVIRDKNIFSNRIWVVGFWGFFLYIITRLQLRRLKKNIMYCETHSKSHGSSIPLSYTTASLFLHFPQQLNKNTLCTAFILDHFILVVFMLHKN